VSPVAVNAAPMDEKDASGEQAIGSQAALAFVEKEQP
jgi:hypothetical protein